MRLENGKHPMLIASSLAISQGFMAKADLMRHRWYIRLACPQKNEKSQKVNLA